MWRLLKKGERRRSKPVESARRVPKAGEARRRRKKKISLALIAPVHAIGQGQED